MIEFYKVNLSTKKGTLVKMSLHFFFEVNPKAPSNEIQSNNIYGKSMKHREYNEDVIEICYLTRYR